MFVSDVSNEAAMPEGARVGQRSGMTPERDQLSREVLLLRTLVEMWREFCRLKFREARAAIPVPPERADPPPVVGVRS